MTKKNDEFRRKKLSMREKKIFVFDLSDADEQRNLSIKLFN
jgi:hypothetical protein